LICESKTAVGGLGTEGSEVGIPLPAFFIFTMIDTHIHTRISIDATGTMEDYCKKAAELGYKYICFTNHMEMPEAAEGVYDYAMSDGDFEEQYTKFLGVKSRSGLDTGFGIELGYSKETEEMSREFAKQPELDFVLGSVHRIFEGNVGDQAQMRRLMQKYPAEMLYERYYKLVEKSIRSGIFDSIAHMGAITRYAPKLAFEKYGKWVERCVDALAECKVCIELNTRDMPKGIFFPDENVLKMCFEKGVNVTIGSDSHSPEGLGTGIKEGFALLNKIGYTRVCIFKQRKQIFLNIP